MHVGHAVVVLGIARSMSDRTRVAVLGERCRHRQ